MTDIPTFGDPVWRHLPRFGRAWIWFLTGRGRGLYALARGRAFWPLLTLCAACSSFASGLTTLVFRSEAGDLGLGVLASNAYSLALLLLALALISIFRPRPNLRFFVLITFFSCTTTYTVGALAAPFAVGATPHFQRDLHAGQRGRGEKLPCISLYAAIRLFRMSTQAPLALCTSCPKTDGAAEHQGRLLHTAFTAEIANR